MLKLNYYVVTNIIKIFIFANMKSRGLGDTIAKITSITGIKYIVNKVADADCGCKARQEALNNLVPYKEKEAPNQTNG
jgi:hypothetical protein